MIHRCYAVVAVTVEVAVDGDVISPGWTVSEVHRHARTDALRRAREVCGVLGKVTKCRVTAVLVEQEEEPVT